MPENAAFMWTDLDVHSWYYTNFGCTLTKKMVRAIPSSISTYTR